MVRLLNGTLMRIFALWQTVACDPTISVLGLSRRLWGWSGLERARSGPCIAGAVVHASREASATTDTCDARHFPHDASHVWDVSGG